MITCSIDFKNYKSLDFERMREKPLFALERDLFYWERWCAGFGYSVICGVDEAGRGPLAGPVVAAAVIMDEPMDGLDDSKVFNHQQRCELFKLITHKSAWAWAKVDAKKIDESNIFKATYLAMQKAVAKLNRKPDFVLVDGPYSIPNLKIPQRPLVHGDRASSSIAAASIIAKIVRDEIMDNFHKKYPLYGFNRHKGYATKEHLEALKKLGPSPIHRLTFKGVL